MGARTRLPAPQGAMGIHRRSDRRPLRVRKPRRRRTVVALLRERDVGVRRRRSDAPPANLQDGVAHGPPLADPGDADVDASQREVLAERAGAEPAAELALPPGGVLERVGVDRLVRTPMDSPVSLIVAADVDALDNE